MGVCIRFVYVENAQEGGSPFFGIAQGVGTARVRGDLAEHVAKFMVAHDSAVKRIQQLSAKMEEIEETMAPPGRLCQEMHGRDLPDSRET